VSAVEIRTAIEADLPRLRVVFRDSSWSNECDRALLTEHPEFLELAPDPVRAGRTRVAAIDGLVVGFASIADIADGLELEDLFVDPAFMHQGVGRALIRDVVEQARQRGVHRIQVDANDHAVPFYEKVGFVGGQRVALHHGFAVRMTLIANDDEDMDRIDQTIAGFLGHADS
jgi:GNAT superfamily N-acetyltransferase